MSKIPEEQWAIAEKVIRGGGTYKDAEKASGICRNNMSRKFRSIYKYAVDKEEIKKKYEKAKKMIEEGKNYKEVSEATGIKYSMLSQKFSAIYTCRTKIRYDDWIYPKLAEWGKKENLSGGEIGEKIFLSDSTFRSVLKGERELKEAEIKNLTELTGLTEEQLLERR